VQTLLKLLSLQVLGSITTANIVSPNCIAAAAAAAVAGVLILLMAPVTLPTTTRASVSVWACWGTHYR